MRVLSRFPKARAQVRFVLVLVLAGAALGVVWRLLAPLVVHLGDSDEQAIGADFTLAILGLVAGVALAVYVLARPGPAPAVRAGAAVIGSLLGGLLAWPVGNWVGRPALTAYGVVLAWPVFTSIALFLSAMLPWTAYRYNDAYRPADGSASARLPEPGTSAPADEDEAFTG